MSNQFSGIGNVGTVPILRTVQVNGEDRSVAECWIYFDRRVPQEDGAFADQGGLWLSVTLWGSRAELAGKLIQKGARVHVVGHLREATWEDDDEQPHQAMQLTVSSLSIDPICIESIVYRAKSETAIEPNATLSQQETEADQTIS